MKRAVLFSVLLLFAASAVGQVHGVPASVTSITPSNHTPGVGASVTSLGPWGYRPSHVPSGGWGNAQRFSHLPYQPPMSYSCGGAGLICGPTTIVNRKHHHGRGGSFYGGYPGYGGYYYTPYYPVYAMEYGTGSYAEPAYEPAEPEAEPPAPTIFERRPTTRPYAREEAQQDYRAPAAQPEQPPLNSNIGVGAQDTTTLVFRDGHKFDIHNYAIVGGAIFNFDGTGPFKTQLSEVDVPATIKLNEEQGVIFKLPQ